MLLRHVQYVFDCVWFLSEVIAERRKETPIWRRRTVIARLRLAIDSGASVTAAASPQQQQQQQQQSHVAGVPSAGKKVMAATAATAAVASEVGRSNPQEGDGLVRTHSIAGASPSVPLSLCMSCYSD